MRNTEKSEAPNLDDMLSTAEAAAWLKMRPRDLLAKSKGKNPRIPAFRMNKKVVRWHPRSIIAKMAADAGVPIEIIMASMGVRKESQANRL